MSRSRFIPGIDFQQVEQTGDRLVGIPDPDGAVSRVGDLQKVRDLLGSQVFDGPELGANLPKALCDQRFGQVRPKGFCEGRGTPTGVTQDIVDVVGVLLLGSIVEGHALHHKPRNQTCHAASNAIQTALRQKCFDLDAFVVREDEVTATGFAGPGILYALRPVPGPGSPVLPSEHIDLHLHSRAEGRADGPIEPEGLVGVLPRVPG